MILVDQPSRCPPSYNVINHGKYRIRFQQYLPIIKPQHIQAQPCQSCITRLVFGLMLCSKMLATIKLDHQLRRRAVKIHNKR